MTKSDEIKTGKIDVESTVKEFAENLKSGSFTVDSPPPSVLKEKNVLDSQYAEGVNEFREMLEKDGFSVGISSNNELEKIYCPEEVARDIEAVKKFCKTPLFKKIVDM